MYSKTKHKHKNPQWDTLGVIQWVLKNRVVKRIFFSVSFFKINRHFKKQHSWKESSSSTTGIKVNPSFKVLFTSLQSFKHCINYHIGARVYKFAFLKEIDVSNFRQCIRSIPGFWAEKSVTSGIVFQGLSSFQRKTSPKSIFQDKCLFTP